MTRDRLLHIHSADGLPCVACGDTDTSDTDFLTNVGQWNSETRVCSPNTRISRTYTITGRADPRTSALKLERMPSRRRVRDRR